MRKTRSKGEKREDISEMKTRFLVVVVAVIVCSAVLTEGEDESEFNYVIGGERGPERWGCLNPSWRACQNGKTQSHINLPAVLLPQPVPISERVDFFYNPANATLKNRGHDIEVKWVEGVSKIRIKGEEYVLKQCHWHTPSEHTINGVRYAMELHLVHQNTNPNVVNGTAVVGILYKLGAPDPFLAQFMDEIRDISDTSDEVEAGVVNPAQAIIERGRKYYRYNGSLTTPPCTEGVIWTVDIKIGTVSLQQINLLRKAVNAESAKNARPLQWRNGRPINLYTKPIY